MRTVSISDFGIGATMTGFWTLGVVQTHNQAKAIIGSMGSIANTIRHDLRVFMIGPFARTTTHIRNPID